MTKSDIPRPYRTVRSGGYPVELLGHLLINLSKYITVTNVNKRNDEI